MKSSARKVHPVIVRAWGDEPVRLFLYFIENNRCYVGQEECTRPIGLPIDQVFAFDSHRFSTLMHSYHIGNMLELKNLYESIPVEEFACNKYQDNLECLHDQEHFSDSGSTSSGDLE